MKESQLTSQSEAVMVAVLHEVKDDIKEMKSDYKATGHSTPCAHLQVLQGQIRVLWAALGGILTIAGVGIAWLANG